MVNVGEKAESHFKNKPPSDIDSEIDSKSEKEEKTLFKYGNFNNFQDYLVHEEHIIKKLDRTSIRILKEKNARLAFNFSSGWAIFIALLILSKGFKLFGFKMSQTEFLVIIGSLTSSVFAFYILVLKYLFHKEKEHK
jgi:hypothetical protein